MIDQTLHDKIEAYLLGGLSPQEARDFEADIQNDPELAEEVELHRLILPVPGRLAELELQADFARWRQEMDGDDPPPESAPPPQPQTKYGKMWPAALALLLLAGAFWLWRHYETRLEQERALRQQMEKALSDEKLRSENLERQVRQMQQDLLDLQKPAQTPVTRQAAPPAGNQRVAAAPAAAPSAEPEWVELAGQELLAYADNMVESVRGRSIQTGASGEELVGKADSAIQKEKYRQATRLLNQVGAGDPMYPKALEMLAYVYFKRKQYQQAVGTYLKYREFDSDTDKTDWDLCLFYLADYRRYRTEFQALLKKIMNDPQHPRHDKAVSLRKELAVKSIWPDK